MTKIAVVDDDRSVCELAAAALERNGSSVETVGDGDGAVALVKETHPDVVLLDVHLPGRSGLDVFREIREIDRRLPVVFMTADESGEVVIEAMKLGAYDYLAKPLDVGRLRDVVARAVETRRRMSVAVALPATGEEARPQGDAIIGRSPGMIEVYRAIAHCARQDVSVLIRGESGTGKELVARAIYQHGKRSDHPFLAVNCAALHENLLETDLFGHEKGAFTGANKRHIGKFEQCDGGTIFLDEIGDMSLSVQAKVLRVLQAQEFQRLGGTETIRTDVRVIAATNRPLEDMCQKGGFRLDLFHRLNGYEIRLPPLRDRRHDISSLIEHFLARAQSELSLDGFEGISPEALDALLRYDWPGNVRELETTIRQSLMNMSGPVLVPEFLPESLREPRTSGGETPGLDSIIRSRLDGSTDLYAEVIELVERRLLEIVLAETGGNQSRAAAVLGITRGKLRNRIRAFGIELDALNEDRSDA